MRVIYFLFFFAVFVNANVWLNSISYAQTEYAVTDGIYRYWDWMIKFAKNLEQQRLPDRDGSVLEGCTRGWIRGSAAINKHIVPVKSYFNMKMMSNNAFFVSGRVLASADVPAYLHVAVPNPFPIGADCLRNSDPCNGYLHFSATVDFNFEIHMAIDVAKKLVLSNTKPNIMISDRVFSGCDQLDWIIRMVIGDWDEIVNRFIDYYVPTLLPEFAKSMQLPDTVALGDKLYLSYQMDSLFTKLDVSSNPESLVGTANTLTNITVWQSALDQMMSVTTGKWVNQSIADPSEHALIRPPIVFNSSSDPNIKILHTLRISDSVFKTMFTAASLLGYLNHSIQVSILDANMTLHSEWSDVEFQIPADNVMFIHLNQGMIFAKCSSGGSGNNTTGKSHNDGNEMLRLRFFNLTCRANIEYNGNDTDPGLIFQITSCDFGPRMNVTLEEPKLMLPDVILNDVVRRLANYSIDWLNIFFSNYPLILSDPLKPWIPNPMVILRNQPGCCGNLRGYVEIISSCKCVDDSSIPYRRCGPGVCESEKNLKYLSNDTTLSTITLESRKVDENIQVNKDDFYAWYLTMFDGNECTIPTPGSRMSVSLLGLSMYTDKCQAMPQNSNLGSQMDNNWFHINDSTSEVWLFCSNNCSDCRFHGILTNEIDTLSGCHSINFNAAGLSGNYSFGFQRILASDPNQVVLPCVGPHHIDFSRDQYVIEEWKDDMSCGGDNSHISSVSWLNVGSPKNSCDVHRFYFSPNINIQQDKFNIGTQCDENCLPSTCRLNLKNISTDSCQIKTWANASSTSLRLSKLGSKQYCLFQFPHDSNSNSSITLWIIISSILPVLIITFCTLWLIKRVKHKRRLRQSPGCCNLLCGESGLLRFSCGEPITRDRVWDATSIALTLAIVSTSVYLSFISDRQINPWLMFNIDSFRIFGIPTNYLKMSSLFETLQEWGSVIQNISVTILILFGIMWWIRTFTIRPFNDKCFKMFNVSIGCFVLIILLGFSVIVIFSRLVDLETDSIDYFKKHPSLAKSSKTWTSWIFASLAFTYAMDLSIFILHPFTFALVMACWLSNFRSSYLKQSLKTEVLVLIRVTLICIPISLVISAIAIHHVLQASQKWLEGWIIHGITCFIGFCLISIFSSTPRIERRKSLFILLPLFIAGTIYSLILLLADHDRYKFVSIKYIVALWCLSASMVILVLTAILENQVEKLPVHDDDYQLVIAAGNDPSIPRDGEKPKKCHSGSNFMIATYRFISIPLNFIRDKEIESGLVGNIFHSFEAIKNLWDEVHTKGSSWPCILLKFIIGVAFLISFIVFLLTPLILINVLRVVLEICLEPQNDFGKRQVKYRNVFLFFGAMLMIPVIVKQNQAMSQGSKISFMNQAQESSGSDLIWPSGETFLDGCFEAYDYAQYIKFCLTISSFVLFCMSILVNKMFNCVDNRHAADAHDGNIGNPDKFHLETISKFLVYAGSIVVILGNIYPGTPNYLALAHVDQVCKPCAAQFDLAVRTLLGLFIGMISVFLEEIESAGIVLSIVPTLVRVCVVMIAIDQNKSSKMTETLKKLMIGISFLTPIITCMPVTILNQVFAEIIQPSMILLILSLSFWITPILWMLIARKWKLTIMYVGFMILYLGHLIVIGLLIVTSNGWSDKLWNLIIDPVFIATFLSSIFITNCALSDFLYQVIS